MADPIVLRELSSRNDAEILREVLESSGIQSFIVADDCGAEGPPLQFSSGARLMVAAEDAAEAEAVLAAGEAGPSPAEEE
jgi:hypothetical protein